MPLIGPPLFLACCRNNVNEVKRLLTSGADVLERVPRGPFSFAGGLAIHACCHFAHVDCLRCLLATGIEKQLDDGRPGGIGSTQEDTDVTPLIALCLRAGHRFPPTIELDDDDSIDDDVPISLLPPLHTVHTVTAACVRLLLDSGASLEPALVHEHVHMQNDQTLGLPGDVALDIARRAGNEEIVRMLEDAARLEYSPRRHVRFPLPARYAAAEWLRLGYQIESRALVPVWAGHVLPFLVSRTSRGAVLSPPVLFIDRLSASDLKIMIKRGDAAKLELQQKSVEERVKCATADAIRDDVALRAAAIDGSLTLRMTRAVVIDRLKLGAVGMRLLKKNYRECMKDAMFQVATMLQNPHFEPVEPQITDSVLERDSLMKEIIAAWNSRPVVKCPADDECVRA